MLTGSAISVSAMAWMSTFALIVWVVVCILRIFDRRATTLFLAVALTSLSTLLSVLCAWSVSDNVLRMMWCAAVLLGGAESIRCIWAWLRLSPAVVHSELSGSDVDRPTQKHKSAGGKRSTKKARQESAVSKRNESLGLEHVLCWGGALVTVAAIIASLPVAKLWLAGSTPQFTYFLEATHQVTAAVLCGIAAACSLELTFFSSPDSLKRASSVRVRWNQIAWMALIFFVIEMAVCSVLLLAPVEGADDDPTMTVLARVFALSLMVVSFMTWIIPHRIASFQESGRAVGWTSLTISAWLASLALCVAVALPSEWPWLNL